MSDMEKNIAASATRAMGERLEEVAERPVSMIPVTVEIEQAEIDSMSRVLYFAAEPVNDTGDSGIECGVRVIFIFGESVANALVHGHFDQAGMLVPHAISIQTAGMTAFNDDNSNALVTEAFDCIKLYTEVMGVDHDGEAYDPLTISDLSVDFPHNIG